MEKIGVPLPKEGLLARYDRPVPRYTSYPTAPHFRHPASQSVVRKLLRGIPEDQSVSFYIHIPFCRHLCLYCGCHTRILSHEGPVREYLETVCQEISLAAAAIGRRQKVSHIHFGGGTPNFALTDDLGDLLNVIGQKFTLSDTLVIAMEMDPRLLTRRKAQKLVKLGVSRVSLGVQDFQPDVQKAVGRIQSHEHVRDCVGWFREEGIGGINFDMIYGLPFQTPEKIGDNVRKLGEMRPERVAFFGYAHVPWFKEHQKRLEVYDLPDAAARFRMSETARRDLMEQGYVPVGIDHFAVPEDALALALKEKRLRRNFQGYAADGGDVLIAFGQTAISGYGNAYTQNTDRNREYRDRVGAGEFPVVKACLLSPEDIYRRSVIESIMCYGEVDLKSAGCDARPWACGVWESARQRLAACESDGLVELGNMTVSITPAGRPFTRIVAGVFDAYLLQQAAQGAPRHARAV
ncbi:MAG: oxygen-independent coproporphyrinogen III oxidase [Pseudomonadota bacterium]